MTKLNKLIQSANLTTYGFTALKDLERICNKNGHPFALSSLSPAIMAEMGISSYLAPVLPRGAIFHTADDIIAADLDVQHVTVMSYPDWDVVAARPNLIVSRHQGTIEILSKMVSDAEIYSGDVNPDTLKGYHVIGTLPPNLIPYTKSYRAVTINDFDYKKDGDLQGEELRARIKISDPITVTIE